MTTIAIPQQGVIRQPGRLSLAFRYLRRNKSLLIGLIILLALITFTVIGSVPDRAQAGLSAGGALEAAPEPAVSVWHRFLWPQP